MSTPEKGTAAALTVLLGVSGWLLAATLMGGLSALGFPEPKMNVGVGVAAGGAAVVILIFFAMVCLIALLAAVVFAVVLERRDPGAWRHAALAAGLGVGLPSLVLVLAGPGLNSFVTAGLPAGLLIAGSRYDVRHPFRVALATPVLALAVALIAITLDRTRELADDRVRDRLDPVQDAADARDAGALLAVLDALPLGTDLDSVLGTLPMRGEHRAELETIARHPKTLQTPCTRLLRASLEGDASVWPQGPNLGSCLLGGAGLALRQGSPALVAAVAKQMTEPAERTDVLDQLAWANDDAAAVRWLHASGLANDAGVLRASAMTSDFLNAMWRHDDRGFYWAHSDVDGLLVALCANDAYQYRLVEALEHGARVNARTPCGTTPLISICTGHDLNEGGIEVLLDAGADPNLPGARFCLDGAPAPFETPLWHLVKRRGDWNNLPGAAIELLIRHGADVHRRGHDGGTLFDEASDDESVLESLRTDPKSR